MTYLHQRRIAFQWLGVTGQHINIQDFKNMPVIRQGTNKGHIANNYKIWP